MGSNSGDDHSNQRVLFQARWASGFFKDSRWFSANRCLEVRLTSEALITRLMLPYCLFSSTHWGFKNTIPLGHIKSVHKAPFRGWWPTVEITFIDATGRSRCLEICFTGSLPQIGSRQQRIRDTFIQSLSRSRGDEEALASPPVLVDKPPG